MPCMSLLPQPGREGVDSLPWSFRSMRRNQNPATSEWIVATMGDVVENMIWHSVTGNNGPPVLQECIHLDRLRVLRCGVEAQSGGGFYALEKCKGHGGSDSPTSQLNNSTDIPNITSFRSPRFGRLSSMSRSSSGRVI